MASGGARNRGGRRVDPNSARSDRRGIKFAALPAEGFTGDAPTFPLPVRRVMRWEAIDGARFQAFDSESTELVAERERQLWAWAWSTPQACAWAQIAEHWRLHTIAMWVRTAVVCESSEATAADKGSLHRFADQIGLTPAGLKENGWAISPNPTASEEPAPRVLDDAPRERRLRAVTEAHP